MACNNILGIYSRRNKPSVAARTGRTGDDRRFGVDVLARERDVRTDRLVDKPLQFAVDPVRDTAAQ
jgi:hypothetical protein